MVPSLEVQQTRTRSSTVSTQWKSPHGALPLLWVSLHFIFFCGTYPPNEQLILVSATLGKQVGARPASNDTRTQHQRTW